jgi:pimeloyl-ACP methyl ester carboxylesterase
VFVYEPGEPSYVTDAAGQKRLEESAVAMFSPAADSLKSGDNAKATRRLISGVAGKDDQYFYKQPEQIQRIQLDNARTVPVQFNAPPARAISCQQLGAIRPPVAVVQGTATTPYFREVTETVTRCIPAAKRIVVPGAGHMWPVEGPADFSSRLVSFLKAH